jgi:antitoxin component YwqK of YwqJK toxin-antitoxin module
LRKGQKDGEWKFYNNEGKLHYTEKYENALLVKRTYYHSNGKIDSETPYTNGVRDGWVTTYAESGDIMLKARYYGEEMQEYTYEDKNGNMVTPIVLKGSTGRILAFYRNGNKSAEYEFIAGEYNGLSKTFSPSGKILWESQEDYGYSEGPMKNYYPDGQLKLLRNYWHNTQHGKYQAYYPDGKIRIDGQYDLDYRHGTWKFYDESGKLVRTEEYFYGTIVNDKQL